MRHLLKHYEEQNIETTIHKYYGDITVEERKGEFMTVFDGEKIMNRYNSLEEAILGGDKENKEYFEWQKRDDNEGPDWETLEEIWFDEERQGETPLVQIKSQS